MAIECNCATGGTCQIHPKPPKVTEMPKPAPATPASAATAPPTLDLADIVMLKRLEAASLKAQLTMEQQRQQLLARAQAAHNQLEQFVAAMFDKYGLRQGEWVFDLEKTEFILRLPSPSPTPSPWPSPTPAPTQP